MFPQFSCLARSFMVLDADIAFQFVRQHRLRRRILRPLEYQQTRGKLAQRFDLQLARFRSARQLKYLPQLPLGNGRVSDREHDTVEI